MNLVVTPLPISRRMPKPRTLVVAPRFAHRPTKTLIFQRWYSFRTIRPETNQVARHPINRRHRHRQHRTVPHMLLVSPVPSRANTRKSRVCHSRQGLTSSVLVVVSNRRRSTTNLLIIARLLRPLIMNRQQTIRKVT